MMNCKRVPRGIVGIFSLCSLVFVSYVAGLPSRGLSPLPPGVYGSPVWSPDSSILAFSLNDELWLYNDLSDSYENLHIDGQTSFQSGIAWLDDSTLLFVATTGFLEESMYSIEYPTGDINLIVQDARDWTGFTINPDNKRILISRFVDDQGQLYFLDEATGEIDSIDYKSSISMGYPLYSPNGQMLALIAREGIVILHDNQNASLLPVNAIGGVARLAWSPNSQYIAYIDRSSEPGIYVVDINSGEEPDLILQGSYSYISWSPDGSKFAYTTLGMPGSNELIIINTDTIGVDQRYISID